MSAADLDPEQRATLARLLAVVLPSTSGPGAAEARAVDYVVRRLAGPERDALPGLRELLTSSAGHEDSAVERLDAERDAWFGRLRAWAWEGFLCDPALGGNSDAVGWERFGAQRRQKAIPR